MKRIMEEAQSNGSSELPAWLVGNRDFRKFLKEAEKVVTPERLQSLPKTLVKTFNVGFKGTQHKSAYDHPCRLLLLPHIILIIQYC